MHASDTSPGRSVDRLTVGACAKANLLLRVLARESSGYHQIETLFTLLDLADELVVERAASGIELVVEGAEIGPVESNLAHRAAAMVLDATGRKFGVRMHLTKRIPVGAGLGGGSADGAAALHAVNALAGNPVPRHEILHRAGGARLGNGDRDGGYGRGRDPGMAQSREAGDHRPWPSGSTSRRSCP